MNYLNRETLKDIKKIISSVKTLLEHISGNIIGEEEYDSLRLTMAQINKCLYSSEMIIDINEHEDGDPVSEIQRILPIWEKSVERRLKSNLENEFWTIYDFFKYVNREKNIEILIQKFMGLSDEQKELFESIPERYTYFDERLDAKNKDYSLLIRYIDSMRTEIENYRWLYERLEDLRSKKTMVRIVRYWFEWNLNSLLDLHETVFKDYWDHDLIRCDKETVLVDCGAYIGDSVLDFINEYGEQYKAIYTYEISEENMNAMKQNLAGYKNIIYKKKGVGKCNTSMFIEEGSSDVGTKVSDRGSEHIEIVALDDDIDEKISMIKMDIEGSEQDALRGAAKHISEDKPALMICTYHKPEDLFQIPQLIEEIRGDYHFYIRYNGRGIWPCDHVLFAI